MVRMIILLTMDKYKGMCGSEKIVRLVMNR